MFSLTFNCLHLSMVVTIKNNSIANIFFMKIFFGNFPLSGSAEMQFAFKLSWILLFKNRPRNELNLILKEYIRPTKCTSDLQMRTSNLQKLVIWPTKSAHPTYKKWTSDLQLMNIRPTKNVNLTYKKRVYPASFTINSHIAHWLKLSRL